MALKIKNPQIHVLFYVLVVEGLSARFSCCDRKFTNLFSRELHRIKLARQDGSSCIVINVDTDCHRSIELEHIGLHQPMIRTADGGGFISV